MDTVLKDKGELAKKVVNALKTEFYEHNTRGGNNTTRLMGYVKNELFTNLLLMLVGERKPMMITGDIVSLS